MSTQPKGVRLRRPQRQSNTPNLSPGCDAPVSLVFRTHNDALSKAAFLFCPKNFNIANPTTTTTTTSAAASASASPLSGSGSRSDTAGASPGVPKRFTATPSSSAAAAASSSKESVSSLVEAIVELRPFFPAPMLSTSGSTMNLTALSPGSPLTSNASHFYPSPSATSLLTRPQSNASLGLGSYADLMSLSSFASPTAAMGGGGAANNSFSVSMASNASPGRYGERLHAAVSPRMAAAAAAAAAAAGSGGGGHNFSSIALHGVGGTAAGVGANAAGGTFASAAGPAMTGGSSISTSLNAGGSAVGGGAAAGGAGAAAGGSGSGGSTNNSSSGGGAANAGAGVGGGGVSASALMHPSGGWICRAMAFNEKEVSHASGAISVNQSLTSKCALINEVAKGKIMARLLPSYQEAQERYGLSHVELTVDNQYVSRSDLFLISEALRERILYEGEEIHVCNFRLRVREMLQVVVNTVTPVSSSPAIPIATPTSGSGSAAAAAAAAPPPPASSGANTTSTASYVRVGCGIVLPTTRVNFQSLSPVHYVVVELAREMWDTTIDGRIALTWAIRKFISELLLKQLPRRKASPLIRVVFTGRLHQEFQFGRHCDVFHMLELPREARNVDVVEEIRMHCEALVDRVLREVQAVAYAQLDAEVHAYREGRSGRGCGYGGGLMEGDAGVNSSPKGLPPSPTRSLSDADAAFEVYVRSRRAYIDGVTAKRLFVHSKQSNTLEALSILLERCTHHYIDRHLTLCGHAVTIVSAGKGFYQVTNSLVQIVCARLHDMGLDKVHVVCIGRPPLHVTPLLEYTSDDDTLRSQYHLHSRVLSSNTRARGGVGAGGPAAAAAAASAAVERFYETPEWMGVFFFHSALRNNGGETVFELLPKECWQREHPMVTALDAVWAPQELSAVPFPSAMSNAVGGAGEKSLVSSAASRAAGGEESEGAYGASAAVRGFDRQQGEGGAQTLTVTRSATTSTTSVSAVGAAAAAAAVVEANPPLLIPGLGLRSYPLPDVTLPAPAAMATAAEFDAGEWLHPLDNGLGAFPGDGNSQAGVAAAAAASRTVVADSLEMSATASRGTDHVSSPLSPVGGHHSAHSGAAAAAAAAHHSFPFTSFGQRRSASVAGGGVSPLFPAGGAASSPLLVRTTTASSSVFASPNVPGRGSMPRGGGGGAAWREQQQQQQMLSHGLHSSHNASQNHLGPPPHPTASAFSIAGTSGPPLQVAGGGGAAQIHRGQGSGLRRGESSSIAGSMQRQVRLGGGGSSYSGNAATASRLPLYTSSSSIAVSVVGPGGNGGSTRNSHPNSLTSYSTSSHPALHMSRSFDYKTTANPAYHSLGNFERSVRSAGSSYVGRPHVSSAFSARMQPRSLLYGDHHTGKPTSLNSVAAHPSVAVNHATFNNASAVPAGAGAARAGAVLASETRSALPHHHHRSSGLQDGVVSGTVAVCTWYCLHAAKVNQESAAPTATGVSAAKVRAFARGGGAEGVSTETNTSVVNAHGGGGGGEVATTTTAVSGPTGVECTASPAHPAVGLPAVLLPAARPWHKALTRTRTDAVLCGCNVVDSDLRNGYLILEVSINVAVLPSCFWAPRLLLEDQGWAELMSCFTGRDDRLTMDANSSGDSEGETEDGDDSMTIGGGSSSDGFFGASQAPAGAAGASASSSSVPRAEGLRGRGGGGVGVGGSGTEREAEAAVSSSRENNMNNGHGSSTTGDSYRFQSDFRAVDVFCRSHSGISADGRTLIIPTHNNGVQFQSSEEVLLRLQPHLFVSAVDEGGEAALERRGPISPTSSHRVRDDAAAADGDDTATHNTSMADTTHGRETSAMVRSDTYASTTDAVTPLSPQQQQTQQTQEEAGASAATVSSTSPPDAVSRESTSTLRMSPKAAAAAAASAAVDARASADVAGATQTQPVHGGGAPASPRNASAGETATGRGGTTPHSVAATTAVAAAERATPVVAGGAGGAAAASVRPVPLQLPPAPGVALLSPSSAFHDRSPLSNDADHSIGRHASASHCNAAHEPTPPIITNTSSAAATPAAGAVHGFPATAAITVGFVQLRNSLLFAIKPINPLRPGAEEEQREDVTALSQSAESASTATVLRRRWQWKHPDTAAEPPHLASWTRLCTCRLLPIYGSKPAYPREGFYTVSPHQYTVTNPTSGAAGGSHGDAAQEKRRLLEFVLQRLQQQYQIVVDAPGLAAGAQWPRADPSPNARLEMSLGHQTHTLKVGETAKAISVTRMLHRGMYSNGQVTHMLSYRYLLWNYLADEFDTREVHMEVQVGERNAFRWESLDRWLQERPEAYIPRGPDLWLRSREVAVMLLPEDPAHPPSFDEFYRFIGYRFSVHLSTHGKVEWKRHSSGLVVDITETPPLTFPAAPSLMDVVLVHDNPQTLDTRNVMDRVTGRTIAFDVPVEERYMSVDVSLPQQYDTHCCYFLKVSWLVCAASLVVDWFGSFIANASRFHLHAVPISCYYNSPKAESLTAHYDVVAASPEEEPALRRALVDLLVSPAYRYYPDTPVITRNCRLVHLSGLCCVILPPSTTMVAQWYQNACLRQGSVEQLQLLMRFKEAEAQARSRAAAVHNAAAQ